MIEELTTELTDRIVAIIGSVDATQRHEIAHAVEAALTRHEVALTTNAGMRHLKAMYPLDRSGNWLGSYPPRPVIYTADPDGVVLVKSHGQGLFVGPTAR